ncbi:Thiamine biosynthesis ATP pyrophosphatase [Thermoplasmatales archaeon BRNA1]|nr:Thiamine biosynthesis ATP pyrophosphatase [Thermoplasmatales archaeon BRNA1]
MAVLMLRYSEIGLKTNHVRSRFENRLKDNLIQMLAADGVEALVERGDSRFFIQASDLDAAVRSCRKVFGVASISIAETCEPNIDDICASVAEYSKSRMVKGKSFAVKARRAGNQKFTSMEVAKLAGDAIWNANLDKDPKVDLTNPDVRFYIEVRPRRAYIFENYIEGHAGLPLGTQGHVLADVDDERGLLSAWMMMKRGCKVYVRGSYDHSLLEEYDPFLKVLGEGDIAFKNLGYVKGWTIDDILGFDPAEYDLPVFMPTIGMTDGEVESMLAAIRKEASESPRQ